MLFHELQYYRLNYQTDVQICSQYVWDNHKIVPTVIGKCCMVVIGTKSKNCCHQKTQQISISSINGIWLDITSVANDNGMESEKYMLQGVWLGAILEVTDI
ncbi:hypothetical protein TNCV_2375981 [Trichonephila clavipes]|nr:hypothetical protein TNCV_2375981 [Trichonephila clavipes]